MNLFIDVNIYLNYFKMSSENTDSLDVLLKILKTKDNLRLLLPEQVLQEYSRNRSNIANETELVLKKQKKLKLSLPPAVRNWSEAKEAKRLFKRLNSYYGKIIKRYNGELKNENSRVDKIINEIFDKATKISEEKNIMDRAYYRMLKGNPPGKKNSYGDAIIWESILDRWTNENLAIVTNDGDWLEKYDKKSLNRFLFQEWQEKAKKRIKVYSSLGKFINNFKKKPIIKKKTIKREEKLGIMANIVQAGISIKDTASTMGGLASSAYITPGFGISVSPSTTFDQAISTRYFPESTGLRSIGPRISLKKECPICKSIDIFDTGEKVEGINVPQMTAFLNGSIYKCKNCGEKFIFYE